MDLELKGKRALVTGASAGIGLAITRALATEDADVAMVARTPDRLQDAAAQVAAESTGKVLSIIADIGDDDSVAAMAQTAIDELGGIDILVNCAARREEGPSKDEDLLPELDIKVRGALRCARALAPGMVERGWGRIINIGGGAARSTGSLVRSIRNVAVTAASKNLADELGTKGVNVVAVHPGMTYTETMPERLERMARGRGVAAAEMEHMLASRVSIGRLVTAAEVADVVVFLASPRSVALNGDAVMANGGTVGPIYY